MKKKDLIGKHFGNLIVLGEAPIYISPKGYRKRMWRCKCSCGNISEVMGSHLTTGHTTSCGCMKLSKLEPRKVKDITGNKYGMLTVMYRQENRMIGNNSRVVWRCKCDCGNESDVLSILLKNGQTKSCGCLNISHAERIMIDFLNSKSINFEKQYNIDELCGINGGLLYFDFAIFDENNELLMLVELDGIQHQKSVLYFGGDSKYKSVLANDLIKNKWCVDNFIDLIRIDISKCTTEDSFIILYDKIFSKLTNSLNF